MPFSNNAEEDFMKLLRASSLGGKLISGQPFDLYHGGAEEIFEEYTAWSQTRSHRKNGSFTNYISFNAF